MKGNVVIEKSFDDTAEFSKELEKGDFEEFFAEEGEYIDKLVETARTKGKKGDVFTITYTVTVSR